ncbi:S-layer homology domain-containing protein [Paenibacillus pasadenensis]|uniref:S-layer homology domain-containing protein n=1 Tax=Paenibacillus pasadenensis TaxID=217090 RepID=UPI0020408D47|nr:S-layer homology domain-containing protein [Paenibacillus pasadenensis]MCM3749710.1 S-layer homology domain-containing protein [Paenibacillus pasadenensis]
MKVSTKKVTVKAILSLFLSLAMLFSSLGQVFASSESIRASVSTSDLQQGINDPLLAEVKAAIEGAAAWTLGLGGVGDWQAVALSTAEKPVPQSYLSGLQGQLISKNGTYNAATDYARISLALTAAGQDASKFAGFNLIERLYNHTGIQNATTNNFIYALIALDSGSYLVPENAEWNRQKLVQKLIERQNKPVADGGLALGTGTSDPDITAMALISLAPYSAQPEVEAAIGKIASWLSANQTQAGGYTAWGSTSSESVSQAIIGLTSAGIDPTDVRFTKNGVNLLQNLLKYRHANGSFLSKLTGGPNSMATEQAIQALVAYAAFKEGKQQRLYDFGERQTQAVTVQIEGPEGQVASGESIGFYALDTVEGMLNTAGIPFTVSNSSSGKFVSSLNGINAGTYGGSDGWKYIIYRDGAWVFPTAAIGVNQLRANDKIVVYYAGADTLPIDSIQVTPAEPKAGEPFKVTVRALSSPNGGSAPASVPAAGVQVKIGTVTMDTYANGEALFNSGIVAAGDYTMEVTGYQADKAPSLIPAQQQLRVAEKLSVDPPGGGEGPEQPPVDPPGGGEGPEQPPVDPPGGGEGPEQPPVDPPGGGEGPEQPPVNPPGNGGEPVTEYATLSVTGDILKGTILPSTKTELQAGDTAFSLLNRALPGKVQWSGSGGSLYVQGIDGLSEFDRGEESGWMYSVNGVYPDYSAGEYALKPGDIVAWRYTLNLGADLGQYPNGPGPGGTPPGQPESGTGPSVTDKMIDVPIQQDYVLHLSKPAQGTERFTLNIPVDARKVSVHVGDVRDGLPQLTANKGNLVFSVEPGTKVTTGNDSIELFTALDTKSAELNQLIQRNISKNEALDKIQHAFVMGAEMSSFLFDRPVTLTIKGGKGQLAGFIEGGQFTPIQMYESEASALQANNGAGKITYAFISGNDLVIRTNHFTSFVTYNVRAASNEDSSPELDLGQSYSDASHISSWALDAMKKAVGQNIVQGSGGKLSPKTSVTRAEFAKLMAVGLGLNTDSGADGSGIFTDVPRDAWFAPYVYAAHRAGIITGYQSNFNPNDTITREQIAAMIVRALDAQSAVNPPVIKDLNRVASWAKAAVQTSVALGLMTGYGGAFDPSGSVTREMAAVVAIRAINYKASAPEKPAEPEINKTIKEQLSLSASYLQETVPNPSVSTLGGEWTVFGLARSGAEVPQAYFDRYYANMEKELKESSGVLHSVKYTEYSRAIVALTAIGRDVKNVAGYNLLEKLADFDALTKQGINGPIFALIALDSKQYDISSVPNVKNQTTRAQLVDFILNRKLAGGGWALGVNPSEADPDVTAMAIQSLAPYYRMNPNVQAAVESAVSWLSSVQQADGGFASRNAANSESVSQVIVALASIGINPHTDSRFVKNGDSAVSALLSFAASGGGFYHIKPGGKDNGGAKPGNVDGMATDQAMYAMVAFDRLISGKTRLYDMTGN